jgi:CcmD family protein
VFELFTQQPLYVVLLVVLVVWAGIYAYLFRLDGRVKKLEERK